MPDDGPAREHDQWHEVLRAHDDHARRAEDAWMVAEAVGSLERRLDQANADRHALGQAVALRDRLLAELSQALRERDALVGSFETELARLQALARQPLPLRLARRAWREVRRLAGRTA